MWNTTAIDDEDEAPLPSLGFELPEHPGVVVKLIRQSKTSLLGDGKATVKWIARACGVKERTIQRIEDGTLLPSKELVKKLARALSLLPHHYQTFHSYFDGYRELAANERRLASSSFATASTRTQLRDALDRLRKEQYPAFLSDALMFCPVHNQRMHYLFAREESYRRGSMWHGLGIKYETSPTIRRMRADEHHPYADFVADSFHARLAPYQFTTIGIALQRSLFSLAPTAYHRHWYASTMLTTPAWSSPPDIIVPYRKATTKWRLHLDKVFNVESSHGTPLHYELLTFRPADEFTTQVADDLVLRYREDLIFATDYGPARYEGYCVS